MNFQYLRILKEAVVVYVKVLSPPRVRKTTGNPNWDSLLPCPRSEPDDSVKVCYNELAEMSSV
jgi:hypothetical protein